ncbi:MAG: hypothetical protein KBC30_03610 [Planctomycetes bacterium]|nr:hypothetical protein [Planctomycetota bacterium]HPY75656.1 hypothetical protein [Planctomycetota bacterium]HQB00137.1 hypothetical protein [Planctomycetota bacterium]
MGESESFKNIPRKRISTKLSSSLEIIESYAKKDNVAKFAIPPFPSSVSSSVSESHNTPATKASSSFSYGSSSTGISSSSMSSLKLSSTVQQKTNQDPLQNSNPLQNNEAQRNVPPSNVPLKFSSVFRSTGLVMPQVNEIEKSQTAEIEKSQNKIQEESSSENIKNRPIVKNRLIVKDTQYRGPSLGAKKFSDFCKKKIQEKKEAQSFQHKETSEETRQPKGFETYRKISTESNIRERPKGFETHRVTSIDSEANIRQRPKGFETHHVTSTDSILQVEKPKGIETYRYNTYKNIEDIERPEGFIVEQKLSQPFSNSYPCNGEQYQDHKLGNALVADLPEGAGKGKKYQDHRFTK